MLILTPEFSLQEIANSNSNCLGSIWIEIILDETLKSFDVLFWDV
jgi:hypothetical protein